MRDLTLPEPMWKMPNPTEEYLASPEFEAIWGAIKSWDINAPLYYEGYCGANGSHVKILLEALAPIFEAKRAQGMEEMRRRVRGVGPMDAS